jgi:hypothetical protein
MCASPTLPCPDDVLLPSFGPRMVCTGCGMIGADVRPNWKERPERPERPTGSAVALMAKRLTPEMNAEGCRCRIRKIRAGPRGVVALAPRRAGAKVGGLIRWP